MLSQTNCPMGHKLPDWKSYIPLQNMPIQHGIKIAHKPVLYNDIGIIHTSSSWESARIAIRSRTIKEWKSLVNLKKKIKAINILEIYSER